jgi:hypothetical protein
MVPYRAGESAHATLCYVTSRYMLHPTMIGHPVRSQWKAHSGKGTQITLRIQCNEAPHCLQLIIIRTVLHGMLDDTVALMCLLVRQSYSTVAPTMGLPLQHTLPLLQFVYLDCRCTCCTLLSKGCSGSRLV